MLEHSSEAALPDVQEPPNLIDYLGRTFFARLHEYEELLNGATEVTMEERQQILNELDSTWPYLGQSLTVTGYLTMPVLNLEQVEEASGGTTIAPWDESVRAYVRGLEVKCHGFTIAQEPVYVDGNYVMDRERICHALKRAVSINHPDGESTPATLICTAQIDEARIDYPFEPYEYVIEKLTYYFPEQMEEIEERALNADDEISAIYELSDLTLDLPPQVEVRDFLLPAVEYLNKIIGFDYAPYILELSDDAIVFDLTGDSLVPTRLDGINKVLVQPLALCFTPEVIVHRESAVGTHVSIDWRKISVATRCNIIAEDLDDDVKDVVIPLKEILRMDRVRDVYDDMVESAEGVGEIEGQLPLWGNRSEL